MRDQIAKGAAWMVLFRLFDRSIGIVSTAVLARLLIPNDFGLVAMAMAVIVFIELATAFGFELALIQMRAPEREHYDTAWTLNLLVACGGAVVTALAAYPAAAFYGDDRVAPVMLAIGAAWLVSGFENVGTVNFRREMDFGAEFRWLAGKRVIAFVVTMAAAFALHSYWALVIGTAAGRVAGVLLSYALHPYRPRPNLSLARARELFSFSGWVFGNNVLNVALDRVPHFVVGRLFGAQSLGAYTVAAEIANLASTELIAPINRAMFPGYARLTGDPPLFRKTCIEATAVIMLIALPVCMGIAVLAGPFVRLLLGAQWGEAVPLIQVLAVAAAVSAITSNNIAAYLALGRPYLATLILGVWLVVLVIGMAVAGRGNGAIGVAWAELAAALASLAVSLPTLFTTIGIRAREYLGVFWRPLLASALMGWAIWAWLEPGFDADDALAASSQLLAGISIGCVVYPIAVAALWAFGRSRESVEAMLVRRAWDEVRTRAAARGAR
jgi:O-antigen/teichoic acid export membrane protein